MRRVYRCSVIACLLVIIPYIVSAQLSNLDYQHSRKGNTQQQICAAFEMQHTYQQHYSYDSVIYYGTLLLELDSVYQGNATPYQRIEVHSNLGEAYAQKGDYQDAIRHCDEGLELMSKGNKRDRLKSKLLFYTAKSYMALDSVEYGLALSKQSIELAKKIDYKEILLLNYQMIGGYYNTILLHQDKALKWHEKSIALFSSDAVDTMDNFIAISYAAEFQNIGAVYGTIEQLDSALIFYQKAYDIGKARKNYAFSSFVLTNLATTAIYLENQELSFAYIEEAEQLLDSIPDYQKASIASNFYYSIGRIYALTFNDPQTPKAYYLKSKSYIDEDGVLTTRQKHLLRYIYQDLAKLEEISNPEIALKYYKRHWELDKDLSRIEAEIATEKLEKELGFARERIEFEKKQLIQTTQLENRRLLIIILLISLLPLILFSLVTYRNYRIKTKLNAQLIQSNIQLNRYAYSISHDILSKLKLIVFTGNAMIEGNKASIESYKNYYEKSRSTAQWLRQYCMDLLAWSKQEHTETKAFSDLSIIIQDILDSYDEATKQHNFQIEIDKSDNTIPLPAAALKQIMQNLIDNAIKFSKTESKPTVLIKLSSQQQSVVITVENNGMVLPNKFHGNLFNRLKTDTGQPSKGLAIVESIVKQYKGNFSGSTGEFGGAKFVIEFFKAQQYFSSGIN